MTYEEFKYKYEILPERLAYLIAGFLRCAATDEEAMELESWSDLQYTNQQLLENMLIPDKFEKESADWYKTGIGTLRKKLYKALLREGRVVTPVYKLRWVQAAAASVIIAVLAYIAFWPGPDWKTDTVQAARLTLPNGKKLVLDSRQELHIGSHAEGLITKKNGAEISYSFTRPPQQTNKFYTLHTPVSLIYKVNLQDGTRVWVDHSSAIRFPRSFSETDRTVEIVGHAYFEVMPDKRPFIVKSRSGELWSANGNFDLNAHKHIDPYCILEKGDAKFMLGFTEVKLDTGFRATVIDGAVSNERVETSVYTSWRHGVLRSTKEIFERSWQRVKEDGMRVIDSSK